MALNKSSSSKFPWYARCTVSNSSSIATSVDKRWRQQRSLSFFKNLLKSSRVTCPGTVVSRCAMARRTTPRGNISKVLRAFTSAAIDRYLGSIGSEDVGEGMCLLKNNNIRSHTLIERIENPALDFDVFEYIYRLYK
jgi:hypothetical protein